MRSIRKSIMPQQRLEAAQQIAKNCDEWLGQHFSCVALYSASGSEMDVLPLAQMLARRGVQCALPVVGSGKNLRFKVWGFGQPLVRGAYGLFEPHRDAEDMTPDCVIVPLLAFDEKGFRLGQGGGFYDATLRAMRLDNPHLKAVGYAYDCQLVESVFAQSHDEKLDLCFTQKTCFEFS